jgi:hypothetical protein
MSKKVGSGKIIPDPGLIKPKRSESDRILIKLIELQKRLLFKTCNFKELLILFAQLCYDKCIRIFTHAEKFQEKKESTGTEHAKVAEQIIRCY